VNSRRSKLRVLYDVVRVVRDNPGIIISDLTRKANLNGGNNHRRLVSIASSSFVEFSVVDGSKRFFATDKGCRLVADFEYAEGVLAKYGFEKEGVL
jgi:predicted transcriptional regulator